MRLAVVLGVWLVAGLACVESSQKWSYVGATGPHTWHELFPHACGGKNQSPIDLKPEESLYHPDLKEFAIWYDPPKPDSKMMIKNNGHTVQVDLEGDFFVTNGGLQHVYKAAQFHFHWGDKSHRGSEHVVEGQASPIEMHVVSYNRDLYSDIGQAVTQPGGLAVLGVLFQLTEEDNTKFDYIIRGMEYIRNPDKVAKVELPLFSLRDLLPDDIQRYYRYNGSLTTPGCFETVTWTVFDQMQSISHRQMKQFRKLLQFRRKHHRTSKHHKQELSNSEKENNAKQALDELGISGKDNKFEREVLKEQLINSKEHTSNVKIIGEGGKESESGGYVQDYIVNNYRPVQPINDRIVYRSFKLRNAPALMQHDQGGNAPYKAMHGAGSGHNATERLCVSMAAFLLLIICPIIKSLL